MNAHVEMLVRELQMEHTRELEQRMLVERIGKNVESVSRRERAVLWAGALLVSWGQKFQAAAGSTLERQPCSEAELATATK